MNDIAIRKRFVQALEEHDADAVAAERAFGLRIEGTAVSIG